MRLISVVMGSETKEDRNKDTMSLMESMFSNYSLNTIIDINKKIGTTYVDKSINKFVDYYLKENVNVVFNKDTEDINYEYDIKLNKNITAPLNANETIGKLILKYNNKNISYDLVVKTEVKKANFFVTFLNNFKDIISGNINNLNA